MTAGSRTAPRQAPTRVGSRAELVTRAVVVLGLAVDAFVHLRMAPVMDVAAPDGIGGGNLFRIQGVVAGVASLVLLLTGRRWAYLLALLVALSALVPVILYHFVNVPAIGPVPSMYDPLWSPEKVVSIVGEALAAGFAVRGMALTRPRPHPST
ncbi:hypothetical protein [Ornithinimicrobium pekingense]|uniref:DoxX family membrane protein n=1 Tax=Ornithinimicrobium pekingense TaxID=384677 RepID=A0ABQ2F3S0_9MICO|nr:hypothetical protein [Ornithinimicrobium pekingense]GGK59188.1 hypothetical protein GCM10011509_04410 [Ornithinimicrobium pekingense]